MSTYLNTVIASGKAGGPLRGEVAFERWYVHYHDKVNPQEIDRDPSMIFIPRIWALACVIESFIKTIIASISILYYALLENQSEKNKRIDVKLEQDNSLYYSLYALCSPEEAVNAFNVYRGDAAKALTRTSFFGFSLGKHSWGTMYKGTTTVKMLINTH